ncbi:hypothetical protein BDZ91DRAFT_764695 [Kalaharituber pfeilii]|nr:hypothetical protein BDZ91DRAFT_764695 [Kalaharituber pfeilii]
MNAGRDGAAKLTRIWNIAKGADLAEDEGAAVGCGERTSTPVVTCCATQWSEGGIPILYASGGVPEDGLVNGDTLKCGSVSPGTITQSFLEVCYLQAVLTMISFLVITGIKVDILQL